jgi:hypothetical protein
LIPYLFAFLKDKEIDMEDKKKPKNNIFKKRYVFGAGILVGAVLVLFSAYYGYLFATTSDHMRNPSLDHYHFRTQLLVDGELVDFSADEFQQEYDKNSCSADLSGTPIDFHDNEGQMTHIHWSGITGGELLKYYGWNLIGGDDDSMGTRFDQGFMSMHRIPTYGDLLPDVPEGANYYIYTGDEHEYEKRDWEEFLNSDLEDFFGVESLLHSDEDVSGFNILDLFSGKAYAHGDVVDEHDEADGDETEEERLTRINNLIGNVVIFVQSEEPSDEQIVERFNSLSPLTDSVCGG